ncbi:MAG: hypothetical protein L6N96_00300, partial [Candidatus Methylarchaceae archaeon HK02M2]|nr:hypothetical protein [Candidatus Methylarchaceae archaeon HK02M2]
EKPSAILIENGEVKNRIDLQNDDVKDTAGLMKMLSEEKQSEEQDELKEESDSCKVKFEINKKNWKLEPELSEQCERELSKIDDLRPAAKRYIKRHISEE